MTKKRYLILYSVSLVFFFVISLMQKTPGYMDASYYFATGRQLAGGNGVTEPFIWNYLSNPQSIPTPAFTYWMPLSVLLAALGMWMFNSDSFFAARTLFILLAAFLPTLTVYFVSQKTSQKVYIALAVLFSLLCGAYLPYLTITETFTPFFVLGALFLIVAGILLDGTKISGRRNLLYLLLGIITGLMHLTRADGILWLAGGFLVVIMARPTIGNYKRITGKTLIYLFFLVIGYLCVMAGWFSRNILIFGSFFPEGSNLAIWFIQYDDLFMYPSSVLTFQRLINTGWPVILKSRCVAGLANLQTLLGVNGNVVLLPFMMVGAWRERKNQLNQLVLLLIALLFCLMTFVFPYAGYRGGFLHSMSAFQIYLWSLTIIGIEATVHWTILKLNWVEKKSRTLFATVLILGITAMTCITFVNKVQPLNGTWDQEYANYERLAEYLQGIAGGEQFSVMINDSPGYYGATQREAIQLSSGSILKVKELLHDFDIDYLVIDVDAPVSLKSLYENPGSQNGLILVDHLNGYFIYAGE